MTAKNSIASLCVRVFESHCFCCSQEDSVECPTATHSIGESSKDDRSLTDQSIDEEPNSNEPSTSKYDERNANQIDDFTSTFQPAARTQSSVMKRISNLMIRNNVSVMTVTWAISGRSHCQFICCSFHCFRIICRATKIPNCINFGCPTTNPKNVTNVHRNFQRFVASIIVDCVAKYSAQNVVIKSYLEKLSIALVCDHRR